MRFALGFLRRLGRVKEFHHFLQHLQDGGFMHIQPARQSLFQMLEPRGEFLRAAEQQAHVSEGAHHKHTHADDLRAVQHIRRHDGSRFREGVRQVFDVLSALQGRNLRP